MFMNGLLVSIAVVAVTFMIASFIDTIRTRKRILKYLNDNMDSDK